MMGATAALTLFMPKALSRLGYRGVFILGASLGAAGCALATYSIWFESFALFCLAGALIGVYQASALYYRFAAADAVDGPLKSTAIAWVLSGGIAAALIGPMIGKNLLHSLPVEYTGAYLAAMALCLLAIPVLPLRRCLSGKPRPAAPSPGGRCRALPCRPCCFAPWVTA